MRFLLRFFTLLLAVVAPAALAVPNAYVPNEGSGSVSVIDTTSDRVTATIKTGGKPRGIAVGHDAKRLYISDQAANSLVVFDTATNAEIARSRLGDSPEGIYLSPDGRWLSAAIEENNQVLIVDASMLLVSV